MSSFLNLADDSTVESWSRKEENNYEKIYVSNRSSNDEYGIDRMWKQQHRKQFRIHHSSGSSRYNRSGSSFFRFIPEIYDRR
jgi:hypothetical protein